MRSSFITKPENRAVCGAVANDANGYPIGEQVIVTALNESAALRERIAVLEAEIKAWRDADLYCDLVGYANGDYCAEVMPDHAHTIRIAREITGELTAALRGKGGGDELGSVGNS